MLCAAEGRISQFSKAVCQKMAHRKTDVDWTSVSQPNVPVILVPKSKPRFPAIILPWENPLFWCFILLSDLPLLFFCGENLCGEQILWFQLQAPYYRWHLSSSVWLRFSHDRTPFPFSLLPKRPGAWLASVPPQASSALQPSLHVWPSSVSLWLCWDLRPRKACEGIKEDVPERMRGTSVWEHSIGKRQARHLTHVVSFKSMTGLRCWCYSYFLDEEHEAQRVLIICL